MIIRVPAEHELQLLPAIESRADSLYLKDRFPEFVTVSALDELEAALRLGLLLVADLEGEIVGFALSKFLGKYVHLQQLSVTPQQGRKGVGASLLRSAIERAHATGYLGVTLTTFSDIPWNAPFYKKWGFVVIDDFGGFDDLRQILLYEQSIGLENRVAMMCEF